MHLGCNIGGCAFVAADIGWIEEGFGTYGNAMRALSPTRRGKALSYRFDKDRKLSVLASLLLDELLDRHGLREIEMRYVVDERGKPSFAAYPELYFSLAHSETVAVAMLGEVPVGVDVEYLPGFPRDLAEPYKWTEMESVGKLIGCGVSCYVDGMRFVRPSDVEICHMMLGEYLACAAWTSEEKDRLSKDDQMAMKAKGRIDYGDHQDHR